MIEFLGVPNTIKENKIRLLKTFFVKKKGKKCLSHLNQ